MKKTIFTIIYDCIGIYLELNEEAMYEVITSYGTPLGSFDPYLSENWDFDDPTIIAEIVEDLIEKEYLYLPYTDSAYYMAA